MYFLNNLYRRVPNKNCNMQRLKKLMNYGMNIWAIKKIYFNGEPSKVTLNIWFMKPRVASSFNVNKVTK